MVYETVERPSVYLSVCLSHYSTAAVGLLLSAVRTEDIDRQRQRQRPSAQEQRRRTGLQVQSH